MIRKLVLGMTILALAAAPLPAWAARDGAHEGRHETRGSHEQFHVSRRSAGTEFDHVLNPDAAKKDDA
jgi:hypothetical protein